MAPKNGKALDHIDFQLNEIVFAKQKGFAPWPAIITAFHPKKPRCAKVEFFAWNQQWYFPILIECLTAILIPLFYILHRAYISFNSLFKMEAGKLLAENHSNNIQLQKAVKEMEFVINVTQRLVNDRVRANVYESEHSSNQSKFETVGQSKSNQKKQKTKFEKPVVSNLEPLNGVRTRSQSCSSSNSLATDVGSSSQTISIKHKVAKVGRSDSQIPQQRRKKSKDQTQIETVKPAASKIRTRAQSAKNEPKSAKRIRK